MQSKQTRDLGLAAYLKTHGVPLEIKRTSEKGTKGVFLYDADHAKLVNKYYSDEEKFLSFSNNIRNIKAQIENSPKEEVVCH